MIDLHCHMLPGLDDGPSDDALALEMARMAKGDGIDCIACTPHFTPGVYENTAISIQRHLSRFRRLLAQNGITLELVIGADIHLAPHLEKSLADGLVPTLGGSHYFLWELPHHVMPPRIEAIARTMRHSGFRPILTHPERLSWIKSHYDVFERLHDGGVVFQVTAGSLLAHFGSAAEYWAERLMDERRVDILASDAHNVSSRPPVLSRARDLVARRWGEELAMDLVGRRPAAILQDNLPRPRRGSGSLKAKAAPSRGLKRTLERLVRGRA